MKKLFYAVLASAAVVLSIESCQKNEIVSEFNSTDGLVFSSEKPDLIDETKTAWTGETIKWSKGDAIRVAYTCDDVWQNADGTATKDETTGSKTAKTYQSTSLSADAETAKFSVPGDFKGTAAGTYVFYGAYPASACTDGSNFKYAPSLTVTIPESQTPAANSFDSAADFMLGKSVSTYKGIPTEEVSMNWDRMVAHAQLTFKTLNGFTAGETISKVGLTADSEADMVGKHYIYLDTKNVNKPDGTVANALTINGTNLSVDDNGTFVAWASFLPCTVKSLTVVVTTNKATYTREIPSCKLEFKKNARNILSIKMDKAVRAELTPQPDYSGEWLIVGQNKSDYYAAQKWASGNNLRGLSIKYDGSSVTNIDGIEDCKMVFTKVETGTYAGMYTIEDASSTEATKSYLYAASSSNNYLKVESSLSKNSYWTINKNNDGTYKIIAEKSANRNLMRFNYSSATSILFSCYEDKSSPTGTAVLLVPYSSIAEDTRTPLNAPENLSCTAQTENSLTFSWSAVENATGYQVSVDGGKTYGATQRETSYTWTGLTASTTKTLYVKAIGDGASYTDSEAATASGTTSPASGGGESGGEIVTLFSESFGKNTNSAREWKDSYKQQGGISSVYSGSTYTITNAKQSKNTVGKTNSGLAQSTQNQDAIFEIKGLNVAAYSDLSVSYYWKAGSIYKTYSTSLYYSKDGGTNYTKVEKTSGTGATTFVEVTYSLPADAVLSNLCLKVVFNTSNTQAVIDDFVLKGTN